MEIAPDHKKPSIFLMSVNTQAQHVKADIR